MKYRIKEIVRSDKSVFVPQTSCWGLLWTDCENLFEQIITFDKFEEAKAWIRVQQLPALYGTIIHEV